MAGNGVAGAMGCHRDRAGPVGENAADRVRKAGLSVAVVEQHLVGGECSFYACSPSKALLRPVHVTRASQRVQGSEGAHLDRRGVFARRDTWINNLSDTGAVGWLDHVGIDLLRGTGRLAGERCVEVGGEQYEARHAVIVSTGTAPLVPDLPGLRGCAPWTNREATTAKVVPSGWPSSAAGSPPASWPWCNAALGSAVTIIEQEDRILGRLEEFAAEAVAESLRKDGADLRLGTTATAVSRAGTHGEVTIELDRGGPVRADEILVAVGRTPNTGDLGLDTVGARTGEQGYLEVNETMEVQGWPGNGRGCMPSATSTASASSRTWASTRAGPAATSSQRVRWGGQTRRRR